MRSRTDRHHAAIPLLLLFALAAPAWSYTVYLRDGSKVVTKDKYVVRGERAILVLESGTETMLPLAEIDVERTERSNQTNLGTAVLIEDGKARDLGRESTEAPRKATLQDLIQKRGTAMDAADAPADGSPAATAPPAPVRRGRAESALSAHTDVLGRSPLRDVGLAETIRTFLFGRGITSVEVLQGNSARRPTLVFASATEGQVFKALAASAVAIVHVRDKAPGAVEAFDVVCRAPDGGNGGRFLMTLAQGQELVAGRISMPEYYVKYVQF